MIAHPQFGSPSFQLAAKGLIALHRLMKDGKDDSPEAEAIRDALDVPLHALNPIEDKRAQWLSEDLYSVSEPETAPPRDGSDSRVDKQMADVRGAIENRDWDRALFLIRDVKDSISPDLLSCVRGTIWLEAGSGDVAQVFFEHALEIDPSNSNAQALHLRSLSKSDLARARQTANAILTDDERYAPLVVAQAAYIRFEEAAAATIGESIRLRHELVPVLERTLGRFEPDETNPGRASGAP